MAAPTALYSDMGESPIHRKSIEDVRPLEIAYEKLSYTVKVVDKKTKGKVVDKDIIKGISGMLESGDVTACMGASGAGKTTMLNVLAGFVGKSATVGGRILVNGEVVSPEKMRLISGFVHQEDVILDTMTAREALYFAAMLRLPSTMSVQAKQHRALEVAELLHLTKALDSIVGSPLTKGMSGGEKRRLSLGMAMITNPAILFLDEPTSGLDTYTAYRVMVILRTMAAVYRRTVVCTIHQPSSEVFQLFDQLVVLAEGRLMYQGRAQDMVGYFSRLGYVCPMYTNPADFLFMEVLNTVTREAGGPPLKLNMTMPDVESGSPTGRPAKVASFKGGADSLAPMLNAVHSGVDEGGRIQGLVQSWEESEENKAMMAQLGGVIARGTHDADTVRDAVQAMAPWWLQFTLLANRAQRNNWRNKLIIRGKAAQTVFLAVIVGLIYLDIDDDQKGVQDRMGSLFFLIVQQFFGGLMNVMTTFGFEKAVFLREYHSRMYALPAYFLSRWIVDLPVRIILPMVYASISYWMVGYQASAEKFFIFCLIFVLLDNAGASIGIFVACMFDDLAVAMMIIPMIILPLMVFSGFFITTSNIPPYFIWLSYLSPMRYGFSAVALNEFSGLAINCHPDQRCPPGYRGEDVITIMNFAHQGGIAANCFILLGFAVALLLLSFLILLRSVKRMNR